MFRYEVKKVFSVTKSKIALILLAMIVGVTCYFATDVAYTNEKGEQETGIGAVRQLRAAQKEWSGWLDEEKVRQVIKENSRINDTPEAKSRDYRENNIAYGWKQGIREIRALLNCSYARQFREYDYYLADSLSESRAGEFYQNRTRLLQEWLAQEAKDQFTDAEKDYLVRQYETIETPFYYDYMKGWTQLFEFAPTIVMITMLFLGYLVAGIFSSEFTWRADDIFFASFYGRNKAVAAKVKAGVGIVTVIYWTAVLIYSVIVLGYLGADGWNCSVQADSTGWKCFYHIMVWQKYLLIITGGYAGCLFMAGLCMYVSARFQSAVLAVMVPFVLIFLPSFVGNIETHAVTKILGLLPDRLLQVGQALNYFDLYEVGGKVIGAVPVLFAMYGALAVVLLPVIYYTGKRSGWRDS